MPIPDIAYRPATVTGYHPAIALIGCGGITHHHLTAYKNAGYQVVALCDVDVTRAEARRAEFFPDAAVYSDAADVLRRDDIEVVDIATHPAQRVPLLRDALLARKHVLSQKPFVLDLDEGERLVELADRQNVCLAVNQNGRWAPHVAYLRGLIAAGTLGAISSVDLAVHWDHNWVVGGVFDTIDDLILYDFAIHWFDMLNCYFPNQQAERVYATVAHTATQRARPPLLAQVNVSYANAQASMVFNADTRVGGRDSTLVVGGDGTALSTGPGLQQQQVTVQIGETTHTPALEGAWFPDGFHGTMAELLSAIHERRQPYNSAAHNLQSLALCFAAIASSRTGQSYRPGAVRSLPQ